MAVRGRILITLYLVRINSGLSLHCLSTQCLCMDTADNLLLNVLKPIPKDVRGNLSDSNNYRGISLCSSLISKAIDNIIIKRYGNLLNTNELQFGFKPNHSTNVCTGIMKVQKHVISYYNNNNKNVYACKLDASKAFDRVHYGTLFVSQLWCIAYC